MNKRRVKFCQLKPGMLILFTRPNERGDRSNMTNPLRIREVFDNHIAVDSIIGLRWYPSFDLKCRKDIEGRMMLANRRMIKNITAGRYKHE